MERWFQVPTGRHIQIINVVAIINITSTPTLWSWSCASSTSSSPWSIYTINHHYHVEFVLQWLAQCHISFSTSSYVMRVYMTFWSHLIKWHLDLSEGLNLMSPALFEYSSASWTFFLLLPLFAVGHNLYLLSPTTWHDTNPKTYLSHFFLTFWRHSCWTHRYECFCIFFKYKNIKWNQGGGAV